MQSPSFPTSFSLEPFRPARGFANNHVQTVAAAVLKPTGGLQFRRVRIDTPDGGFIDLDFPQVAGCDLDQDSPLILLIHGLEGSARRPYACETYRQLAQRGMRAVGMNFRSCGGEMNRTARFYHGGATDDVALVHDWLDRQFPGASGGAVGVSLGGNVLLKYLGELGASRVDRWSAAAVISPPFDLALGAALDDGKTGRLYTFSFLRSLKAKAKASAALIDGIVDMEKALQAQTIWDFDEAFTAPLHGFRSAHEYYTRCSSVHFLEAIRLPTLVVRSLDDPVIPRADIPHRKLEDNPFLLPAITDFGGHCGWMERERIGRFRFWAERQVAAFFASHLM
ncbi:MAG: alpha/beta fold hydrolase [Chloroflexota bacterium]|nr:alpha/beta fold hydrolase [Chloroflexota bacterium]